MKTNCGPDRQRLVGFIVYPLFYLFLSLYGYADKIQTDVPALKDVFAGDFTIGCLLSYKHIGFPGDPAVPGQSAVIAPEGGSLVKYHMNSMSPGNNMKAVYTIDIRASAEAFKNAPASKKDFADTNPVVRFNADMIAQLNWAKRNGFTFRGHTLVWHSQTPLEFFRSGYSSSGERLSRDAMTLRMENYIREVMRLLHESWPGLLSAMDVVNEAVTDTGAFRTTGNEWYATYGDESYVIKAFEFARKYAAQYGETGMKLYYNDYNTSNPVKADGIVRLCKPLYEAGLLDGIGMQEHDSVTYPAAESWIASYEKFYPICNEMSVTELDVATPGNTNNPPLPMLQAQANQYAMLFKCFLERSAKSGRGKIVNVSKDGLNDEYTFVVNKSSSLWDEKYQCKPAFYAIVETARSYGELSSLIASAAKLEESDFSADEWKAIVIVLKSARAELERNYSADISAAVSLGKAVRNLKSVLAMK